MISKKALLVVFCFVLVIGIVSAATLTGDVTTEEKKYLDEIQKKVESGDTNAVRDYFNGLPSEEKKTATTALLKEIYKQKKAGAKGFLLGDLNIPIDLIAKKLGTPLPTPDPTVPFPSDLDIDGLDFSKVELAGEGDEMVFKTKGDKPNYLNLNDLPSTVKKVKTDGDGNFVLEGDVSTITLKPGSTDEKGKISVFAKNGGLVGDQTFSKDLSDYFFKGKVSLDEKGFTFSEKDSSVIYQSRIKFGYHNKFDGAEARVNIEGNSITLNNAYYHDKDLVKVIPSEKGKDFKLVLGNDWSYIKADKTTTGMAIAKNKDGNVDVYINGGESKAEVQLKKDARLLQSYSAKGSSGVFVDLNTDGKADVRFGDGGVITLDSFKKLTSGTQINEIQLLNEKGEISVTSDDKNGQLRVGKITLEGSKMTLGWSDKVTMTSTVVSPFEDAVFVNHEKVLSLNLDPEKYLDMLGRTDGIIQKLDGDVSVIQALTAIGSAAYGTHVGWNEEDVKVNVPKINALIEEFRPDLESAGIHLPEIPLDKFPTGIEVQEHIDKYLSPAVGVFVAIKEDVKTLQQEQAIGEMRVVANREDLNNLRAANLESGKADSLDFGRDLVDKVNLEVQMSTSVPELKTLSKLNEFGLVSQDVQKVSQVVAGRLVSDMVMGEITRVSVTGKKLNPFQTADIGRIVEETVSHTNLLNNEIPKLVIQSTPQGSDSSGKTLPPKETFQLIQSNGEPIMFKDNGREVDYIPISSEGTSYMTQDLLTQMFTASSNAKITPEIVEKLSSPDLPKAQALYILSQIYNPQESVLGSYYASLGYQIPKNKIKGSAEFIGKMAKWVIGDKPYLVKESK